MGLFETLFGGRIKIPPRHRSAAFMNLAFGIPATADGIGAATWDQQPLGALTLTDEMHDTHLTQDGIDADATQVYIEIDLGRVYEVYEINVANIHIAGQGFMKAAGANQDILIVTGVDGETAATGDTRDTQVLAGDGDWYNSTLHFVGNGTPVRYVWVTTTGDGVNNVNVDISEIEVFGC